MRRKIFISILLIFSIFSFVFSAEVVRYVDPDSAAGGDGTTWTLAYDSLFDWEAAEETDLDTANNWHHVYVRASSGTADTTAVEIVGWTTSATDYILIEAASGDEAIKTSWDATRYTLVVAGNALKITEEFVRVKGLQIQTTAAWTSAIVTNVMGAGGDQRIWNCRLRGATNVYVVYVNNDNCNYKVWNTIVEIGVKGFYCDNGTTAVYNCIVYNLTSGFDITAATTVTVKNSAVFKNGDDFDDNAASTIDFNSSDDNDGTNNIAGNEADADWTTDFNGAAAGDFTILIGSPLKDGGVNDPGGGLYSTDIEGDTYVVDSWPVGVDQYVAAGVAKIGAKSIQISGGDHIQTYGLALVLFLNFLTLLCTAVFCRMAWKFRKLRRDIRSNSADIELWNDPYYVEAWKERAWKERFFGG